MFATIDLTCMDNIYKLVNAYKNVEKAAIDTWTTQCSDNVFDCVTSNDGETAEVENHTSQVLRLNFSNITPDSLLLQLIRYFKTMLPMIKKLCADGCMVGIIDLIHNCLKQDTLDELGLTRFETEAIFDLVCIQEGRYFAQLVSYKVLVNVLNYDLPGLSHNLTQCQDS